MDTRINRIIANYFSEMKESLKKQIIELNFSEKEKINELMETIIEYPRLTLNKEDFVKRKRVKNSIPVVNRCIALRANGEQCTRRRRGDCDYCGTHYKSSPNGEVAEGETDAQKDNPGLCQEINTRGSSQTATGSNAAQTAALAKLKDHVMNLTVIEVSGLVYYSDTHGNVYKTEDVLQNKKNPTIIAKYVNNNGVYSIPEFGL